MKEKSDFKLAVLIDADNIPHSSMKATLDEIAKLGVPTIKRIYGDWTKPTVAGWKAVLLETAITPVQQYSYTTGKNATDSAMIIDAMDILHNNHVDGFCLVSSDSDFTRLATRLRESGMLVVGIGEKKTPKPFIVACDKFIYIEIIGAKESPQRRAVAYPASPAPVPAPTESVDPALIRLLENTIDDLTEDDQWAFLAEVGILLLKKKPDFDPRNYGFSKLTPLFKSLPDRFEIDEREVENSRIRHIYVRNRQR